MSKIKADFAAASEIQQLKYCMNYIEEAGEKNKSKNKIILELKKIGADSELIEQAFWNFEEGALPAETEKAMAIAKTVLVGAKRAKVNMFNLEVAENVEKEDSDVATNVEKEGSDVATNVEKEDTAKVREKEASILRKIASKLAYQGFDGDVIYETIEKIRSEFESEEDY